MSSTDFSREELFEADRCARVDPAALTDAQIAMLASYDPSCRITLVEARAKAIAAKNTPPPAPMHPVPQPTPRIDIRESDSFDEIIARNKDVPTPLAVVGIVWDAAFAALKEHQAAIEANLTRINALELRCAQLEALRAADRATIDEMKSAPAATMRYRGIWDAQTNYAVDEGVTFAGSLWIARDSTHGAKPGAGHPWQLAIKGR